MNKLRLYSIFAKCLEHMSTALQFLNSKHVRSCFWNFSYCPTCSRWIPGIYLGQGRCGTPVSGGGPITKYIRQSFPSTVQNAQEIATLK